MQDFDNNYVSQDVTVANAGPAIELADLEISKSECTDVAEQGETGPDYLLSKSDAASEAALVVSGFRSGVKAVIDACVRTNETIQRFRDAPNAVTAFLAGLVDGDIISRNEARLGKASPKLVKLCTIGSHSWLLNREEVLRYLEPGYTVLYQVVVLYNTLQGDEQIRFEQLVQILREERTTSREALSVRTAAAKRANRSVEPTPSASHKLEGDIGHSFELALLTPDRRDLRKLNEDYVDLPPFYQSARSLLADEATVVVVARVADLPVIENRLLPMLGFSGPSHVFLVREPIGSNITDAELVVIADRRQTSLKLEFNWLSSDEPFDVISMAEQLVPTAGRKLHFFAKDEEPSVVRLGVWMSFTGASNWGTER
jgi:hypothetical protein